jgi:biotin-(acetyl-CoA carboxylase) ligase
MRKEANRERFLSEILNGFEELLSSLQDSPKKVLDEWRERCRMIGEPITIDTGTERKYGVFYDIDANGFMLLKSGEEIEKITNGDVSAREKN